MSLVMRGIPLVDLAKLKQRYQSMSNWRASEASETLSGVYKFKLVWDYSYGSMCAITVARATYTNKTWMELGLCHYSWGHF